MNKNNVKTKKDNLCLKMSCTLKLKQALLGINKVLMKLMIFPTVNWSVER